jgi:hypothetical protein
MKTRERKLRMQLMWRRTEDKFIDELDRKLKYNWRDKIDEHEEFYRELDKWCHLQEIKEKERPRTLVCSI